MAFAHKGVSKEKRTGWMFRGREIVLTKSRGRPLNGIVKKHGYYPEEKKLEAAALYAMTGDPVRVHELCGVPTSALRGWMKQPWFQDVLSEIKQENNERLDAKLTEIVQKSQDLILDRLENGDYRVTKDGDEYRLPVGIRDLALVSAISVDKRQIVRNKPTSITQHQGGNTNTLEQLAQTFIELAQKKEISLKTVSEPIEDVEYTEIVASDSDVLEESSSRTGSGDTPPEAQTEETQTGT